jgi:DNA-binding NarL/FixJ family response regulator
MKPENHGLSLKKNQKSLANLSSLHPERPQPNGQKFFASFFQKRSPSFCRPAMKLLIVDDHPVLRQGIAVLVEQAWPGAVVLPARTAAEALALVAAHADLDIVVLDLILPGGGGLEAITDIGRLRQDLPVLVLASSEAIEDIRRALALGACGYVPKSAASTTLLSAIRMGLDGETYIPPVVLFAPLPRAEPAQEPLITPRQLDVLRLLERGFSNKAIAQALGLSEKTVKAHLASIFRTLKVGNRTHAITVARDAGLL